MPLIASKAFSDVIFDIGAPIEFDPHSTRPPRVDHGRTRKVTIRGTSMTTKKLITDSKGHRRVGVRDQGEAAPDAIMLNHVSDADWEAIQALHAAHPLLTNRVIRAVKNEHQGQRLGRHLEGMRTHDRRLPLDREEAAQEAEKRALENNGPGSTNDDTIAVLEALEKQGSSHGGMRP